MRLALAFLAFVAFTPSAYADTVIPGGNLSTQTWTAANSPYVVQGDVTIIPGAVLTIEAGTVVQAASGSDAQGSGRVNNRVEITVNGSLIVNGTATQPVTFKSASTTTGSWYGIIATSAATLVDLEYANIEYATNGVTVETTGNQFTASNVTVTSASTYGFSLTAGSPVLTAVRAISNGSYGVHVSGTADPVITRSVIRNSGSGGIYISHNTPGHSVAITNCTLHANGTYGVYAWASSGNGAAVTVKNSILTGSSYGVYNSYSASFAVTHSNLWNNSSNNNYNVTLGTGTLKANPLYVSATDLRLTSNSPSRFGGDNNADQGALPYDTVATPGLYGVLWSNTTLTAAGGPYTAAGDLTVAPNVTLTIEPGVTLSFASSADIMMADNTTRGQLIVRGTLVANGTPQSPITITSTSTTAGSWSGIELDTTAHDSVLDDLVVRYAINGVDYRSTGTGNQLSNLTVESASTYGFAVSTGSPVLDKVRATSSGSYGVHVSGTADPVITRSVIRNSGSGGIYISHNTPGHSVAITNCTLHANGTYGVYAWASSGNGAAVTVKNSILTGSSYGVYNSYSASFAVTHSNLWNNSSNNNYNVTLGTGTLKANPLYVSATDLRLTSNSPSRFGGDNNADQGALPYDTVATPGLYGVLWSNTTLTAAGGPYTAGGDLTVAPNVTLTIEPGVTLSFASSADIMMADNTTRGQLIVRGTLVANGTPQSPITITSTSTTAGSWSGIELDTTAHDSVLDDLVVRYAINGIDYRSTGTGNQLSSLTVESASTYGFAVSTGSPALDKVRAISSGSYGVHVSGTASPTLTNCVIRNSGSGGIYISHNTPGRSATITNCTLHANGTYGIYAWASSGNGAAVTVKNSILTSSSYGVYNSYSASFAVTYSNLWNNSSNNNYNVTLGTGTLSANPLYVSATDLHVTGTSVVIDAGTTGPSSDADGAARPLDGNGIGGAQWDIGAYEFVLTVQCGNGVRELNETCDDGTNNGMYGYCNTSCNGMGPRCGDGMMNGPEQCDDGNALNTDECLSTCTNPRCGDGYVRMNVEQCDDGNAINTDACLDTCAAASCGDGYVRAGMEECDDGNQSNTDACLATCVAASCGDGYAQAGVEECDDGNQSNTDGCLNVCNHASCGDGFVEAGVEGCDDGNTVETDTCTSTCVSTSCGDGMVDADVEECDDGNKIDSDACRSNCVAARCGDGAIQFGVEECDDGNSDAGDGCDELCLVEGDEMPGSPRGGAGCCESSRGGGPGSLLLAAVVLAGLRRRRRG